MHDCPGRLEFNRTVSIIAVLREFSRIGWVFTPPPPLPRRILLMGEFFGGPSLLLSNEEERDPD
jgi:hypothetical protein